MRIFASHATYLRLFPSSFPSPCLAPVLYLSAGGLMPTSTHLPTSLPAANESEPGWREDVASHYELLMRSIWERPWPRPAAISYCSLYLLHTGTHTVHIQTYRQIFVTYAHIASANNEITFAQMISGCFLTPPETAHLHTSLHCTKQHILMWYFPGDVLMFCWLTSYNLMQESSVLCYWHIPGRLLPYYHNGLHIQFSSLGQPPHQPSPCASPALGQERVGWTCCWPCDGGGRLQAMLWTHSLFQGWHRVLQPSPAPVANCNAKPQQLLPITTQHCEAAQRDRPNAPFLPIWRS